MNTLTRGQPVNLQNPHGACVHWSLSESKILSVDSINTENPRKHEYTPDYGVKCGRQSMSVLVNSTYYVKFNQYMTSGGEFIFIYLIGVVRPPISVCNGISQC